MFPKIKLRNKKGAIDWENLVKLAFTSFLLFLLVFMIVSLLATFKTDSKDTVANFNALADNIDLMLKKPNHYDGYELAIRLEPYYYVKGFDADLDHTNKQNVSKSIVDKNPKECEGFPCICLYKEKKLKTCRVFKPKKTDKIGNYQGAAREQTEYYGDGVYFHTGVMKTISDAFALKVHTPDYYGRDFGMGYLPFFVPSVSIDTTWAFNPLKPIKLTNAEDSKGRIISFENMYIEKVVVGQTAHIMIGWDLDPSIIAMRQRYLQICPGDEDTDEKCRYLKRDSKVKRGMCVYDEIDDSCTFEELKQCELNKEITDDCICGVKEPILAKPGELPLQPIIRNANLFDKVLIDAIKTFDQLLVQTKTLDSDVIKHSPVYCIERGVDKFQIVAPFSCDEVCTCWDYCDSISDDYTCGVVEKLFCHKFDICSGAARDGVVGACGLNDDGYCDAANYDTGEGYPLYYEWEKTCSKKAGADFTIPSEYKSGYEKYKKDKGLKSYT